MMLAVTDLLRPFVGYIPESGFGSRVVGPPRTTLTAQQKAAASGDHLSFRFAAGRKAGTPREKAVGWINRCVGDGVLRPVGPAVVVYRQDKNGFRATGVLGDLSLEAYLSGRVKPHEKTIAKTQRKMADYLRTTRVYGNPAVTAVPAVKAVDWVAAAAEHTAREPDSVFTTVDGISHRLWVVEGEAANTLCKKIDTDLYITDGHHRLASASLVAGEESCSAARIPAGVFASDQFRLRSFARRIDDPHLDQASVVNHLMAELEVEEVTVDQTRPRSRFEFGARVGTGHFRIRIPDSRVPDDHYESLNTNLLSDLVLGPVFGIENPREDKRLKFVADLGNVAEACSDADAWFLPHPLQAADVIDVADSGRTMPAKSTWFAPKLPSGLVIRPIDQD